MTNWMPEKDNLFQDDGFYGDGSRFGHISILSFYILMLSIYLLVQKNSSKLENLLLIDILQAKWHGHISC